MRRRGVGTVLMRWVLEEAQHLGARVGVVAPTRESRSLYQRLGFVFTLINVLRSMCYFNRATGDLCEQCWPTYETLAAKCDVTRATIGRWLKCGASGQLSGYTREKTAKIGGSGVRSTASCRCSVADAIAPNISIASKPSTCIWCDCSAFRRSKRKYGER